MTSFLKKDASYDHGEGLLKDSVGSMGDVEDDFMDSESQWLRNRIVNIILFMSGQAEVGYFHAGQYKSWSEEIIRNLARLEEIEGVIE